MRGGISALCPERPCHAGAAATTARQRCCGIMLAALGAGARHHAVELSLLAGGALSGAYDHGGQCGLVEACQYRAGRGATDGGNCSRRWSARRAVPEFGDQVRRRCRFHRGRSEEHTSELQSLMRISYAVFCLKKKKTNRTRTH